jgi:hypothetical protein
MFSRSLRLSPVFLCLACYAGSDEERVNFMIFRRKNLYSYRKIYTATMNVQITFQLGQRRPNSSALERFKQQVEARVDTET